MTTPLKGGGLTEKVLGTPSQYPRDLHSWLAKRLSRNPLLQIDWTQLPGPRITSGAFSAGPPKNPQNGDIWIATGVDTNGTVWQFRYNAGSSSAYKWEFIGGAPVQFPLADPNNALNANTNTGLTNGLGYTWYYVPGSTLSLPRTGEYFFEGTQFFVNQVGATNQVAIGPLVNGITVQGFFVAQYYAVAGAWSSLAITRQAVNVSTTGNVVMAVAANLPGNITMRWNIGTVVPRRVA